MMDPRPSSRQPTAAARSTLSGVLIVGKLSPPQLPPALVTEAFSAPHDVAGAQGACREPWGEGLGARGLGLCARGLGARGDARPVGGGDGAGGQTDRR